MNRNDGEFVWPPAQVADCPLTPGEDRETEHLIEQKKQPKHGWWSAIERAWLCPVAVPVRERLEMAGCDGEAVGACCDRCATTVGAGEEDEFGCASCRDRKVPWDRAVRLGAYEDELREVILEVKFTRFRSAGTALGRMLGEVLRNAGAPSAGVVVVPIPMSTRRRLVRGVDHTAAIGRGVASELGAPMRMALTRKHRPSQRSVSMSARARNVSGTMRLRRGAGAGIKGRTVVLVDDVRTSGATLRAASSSIFLGGDGCRPAAIWVATVGVTPGRGRMDLAGLARIRTAAK